MKCYRSIKLIMLLLLVLSGCGQTDASLPPPPTATIASHNTATQLARTPAPSSASGYPPPTTTTAADSATARPALTPAPSNVLTQWAKTPSELPRDTEIRLSRTACFGTCPVYTVQIRADGQVTFDGQDYVKHKGTSIGQITPAQVSQLVQQFATLDFFALRGRYGELGDCQVYATDSPSVDITLRFAGQEKTVGLYLGCVGNPEAQGIEQLGNLIDTTVNSPQWIE